MTFPDGKTFAFTIVDDTDAATVDSVGPVYDLLADRGLRTTKTVWVYPPTVDDELAGQSLEDPRYLHHRRSSFHRPRPHLDDGSRMGAGPALEFDPPWEARLSGVGSLGTSR